MPLLRRPSYGRERRALSRSRFPATAGKAMVLSLSKRLRYFLCQERQAVTAVLNIFPRVVEQQALREHASGSAEKARMGAVSFVHRCGSAINEFLHFHGCVIDGVSSRGRRVGRRSAFTKRCPLVRTVTATTVWTKTVLDRSSSAFRPVLVLKS